VAPVVGEPGVTALLEAPVEVPPAPRRPPRAALAVVAALLAAAAALLVVAALNAAPRAVRVDPLAASFAGSAPQVTLPTYGLRGTHVVGYRHGATTRLTLPVHNSGWLPMTVSSFALGGGVAPLLEVREVDGLPLTVGPGRTGSLEVVVELANCRFFHEREVQYYESARLGVSVLGRSTVRDVAFDRPLMVHSPMIVGCPDRKLDRQADDRSDLLRAG
jgi:hypothetical protein